MPPKRPALQREGKGGAAGWVEDEEEEDEDEEEEEEEEEDEEEDEDEEEEEEVTPFTPLSAPPFPLYLSSLARTGIT